MALTGLAAAARVLRRSSWSRHARARFALPPGVVLPRSKGPPAATRCEGAESCAQTDGSVASPLLLRALHSLVESTQPSAPHPSGSAPRVSRSFSPIVPSQLAAELCTSAASSVPLPVQHGASTMRAAVMREVGAPLRVELLRIPRPQAGEVLIKTRACGVCHTDLHVMRGHVAFPAPCVLGHEVSGEVVDHGASTDADTIARCAGWHGVLVAGRSAVSTHSCCLCVPCGLASPACHQCLPHPPAINACLTRLPSMLASPACHQCLPHPPAINACLTRLPSMLASPACHQCLPHPPAINACLTRLPSMLASPACHQCLPHPPAINACLTRLPSMLASPACHQCLPHPPAINACLTRLPSMLASPACHQCLPHPPAINACLTRLPSMLASPACHQCLPHPPAINACLTRLPSMLASPACHQCLPHPPAINACLTRLPSMLASPACHQCLPHPPAINACLTRLPSMLASPACHQCLPHPPAINACLTRLPSMLASPACHQCLPHPPAINACLTRLPSMLASPACHQCLPHPPAINACLTRLPSMLASPACHQCLPHPPAINACLTRLPSMLASPACHQCSQRHCRYYPGVTPAVLGLYSATHLLPLLIPVPPCCPLPVVTTMHTRGEQGAGGITSGCGVHHARAWQGQEDICSTFFAFNRLHGTLYDGHTRLFSADPSAAPLAMYSMGGLADYCVAPATAVAPLPPALPLPEAAVMGCALFTAFGALRHAGDVRAGETVAVVGAGGVGGSCVQVARAMGAASIVAVDVGEDKLQRCRALGATHTVNAAKEDVVDAIRVGAPWGCCTGGVGCVAITGGRGVDVAVEALGRAETFGQTVHAVRDGGRAVMVGIAAAGTTAAVDITRLVRRNIKIIGSYGAKARSDLPAVVALAAAGRVDVVSSVTERYRLDDADSAYCKLEKGNVLGRAIVDMTL
ncbi:unnamed protein product [Closterium sp. NIES-65]|nr:unnamed protein product [Closterium sp. NIES-65]